MKLDFKPSESFRGTQLLRQADNLAYAFETDHKSVDADGAPKSYHHDNALGLDYLANAGYPNHSWWRDVLVPDPNDPSRAFVQPSGEAKGFFISMTALRKAGGDHFDLATYVDSTRFPYVVIPSGFEALPHAAKQGDVGFATHLPSGKTTAFIVGDAGGGSTAKLGEGSIALFTALGGTNPNPKNGAGVPHGTIQYILFPNSRPADASKRWPRTQADIDAQVAKLLASTPGISQN